MPALFDSSSSNVDAIPAGSTSGSVSCTQLVNPLATDLVAVVAVLWVGEANASGATFGATFGGSAMTPLDSVTFNSSKHVLKVYTLDSLPTGSRTVTASFSSMPTEDDERAMFIECATYSGVASIGSATHASASSTAANSVAISSTAAAHRVVVAHGGGATTSNFLSYNQTTRASLTAILNPLTFFNLFQPGNLLLGDAPGAATVTSTATMTSANTDWAAIGVSLAPSVVTLDASLSIPVSTSAGAAMYRTETPAPGRTWVIE